MGKSNTALIGMLIGCVLFFNAPFAAARSPSSYKLTVMQRVCRTRPSACKQFTRTPSLSSSSSSSSVSPAMSNRFGLTMTNAEWSAIVTKKHRSGGRQPAATSESSSAPQIVPVSPTLSLGDLTKNYGDSAFTLSPTTNSSGTITYDSSNTSVATVSGNTVTVTGAGTTIITVTLAASGTYLGATTTATLTVNPIAPTLGIFANVIKSSTDLPFGIFPPISNSSGTFTFTSSNPSVATITGNIVSIHGTGITTITATQAANGNYTSGEKTMTLQVIDLFDA